MAKNCNLPFVTAEANAKSWLRTNGAIDKYLNITDLAKFRRANTLLRNNGIQKYDIDAQWFYEADGGKKAIPNKEAFKAVDESKNINYNAPEEPIDEGQADEAAEAGMKSALQEEGPNFSDSSLAYALREIKKDIKTIKSTVARKAYSKAYFDSLNSLEQILENESEIKAIYNFINNAFFFLDKAANRFDEIKALLKERPRTVEETRSYIYKLNEMRQFLELYANLDKIVNLRSIEQEEINQEIRTLAQNYTEVLDDALDKAIEKYDGTVESFTKLSAALDTLKLPQSEKQVILDRITVLSSDRSQSKAERLRRAIENKKRIVTELHEQIVDSVVDILYDKGGVMETNAKLKKEGNDDLILTREQFKNIMIKADRDLGTIEASMGYLSSFGDPLLKTVSRVVKDAIMEAHTESFNEAQDVMIEFEKATDEKDRKDPTKFHEKYLTEISLLVPEKQPDGTEKLVLKKRTAIPQAIHYDKYDNNKAEFFFNLEANTEAEFRKQKEKIEQKMARYKDVKDDLAKMFEYADLKKRLENLDEEKIKEELIRKWYADNTEAVKNRRQIVEDRAASPDRIGFTNWYRANLKKSIITKEQFEAIQASSPQLLAVLPEYYEGIVEGKKKFLMHSATGNYVVYFYSGEFIQPKAALYANESYEKAMEDPYFKKLAEVYERANNSLPINQRLRYGIVPQIRTDRTLKDAYNDVKEKGLKEYLKEKMKKDLLVDDENQTIVDSAGNLISVSNVAQTINDEIVRNIPVRFVGLVEEENLDKDLLNTILMFSRASRHYKSLADMESTVELLKTVINGNPKLGITARQAVDTNELGGKKVIASFAKAGIKKFATKEGQLETTRILNEYLNDVFYGENELKEAANVFGYQLSLNKVSHALQSMAGLHSLALNMNAMIENSIIGNITTYNESIAGRFYSRKDWLQARMEYNTKFISGTFLKDLVQPLWHKKSLLTQMAIKFDAIQGEWIDPYGKVIKDGAAKLMSRDALFFTQNAPEHQIQIRAMIAFMKGYKVPLPEGMFYNQQKGTVEYLSPERKVVLDEFRDKVLSRYAPLIKQQEAFVDKVKAEWEAAEEGDKKKLQATLEKVTADLEKIMIREQQELDLLVDSQLSLYDVYEIGPEGKMKVKDEFVNFVTPELEAGFRRRLHEMNKLHHGNYSKIDKSSLQRKWWGQLFLLFRKYFYTSAIARFKGKNANYELEDVTQGYYTAFFGKLFKDFKAYRFWAFKKLYDGSATKEEQYAIRKFTAETISIVSLYALYHILCAVDFGDDDDELINKIQDSAKLHAVRSYQSLGMFSLLGADAILRTLKSPSAVLHSLEKYYEFLGQFTTDVTHLHFETYKRDSGMAEKGDSKSWIKLIKAFPLLRQVINFMTPEDQIKFYQMKQNSNL